MTISEKDARDLTDVSTENPTNPAARYRRGCDHVDATPRSQVPESDCFILRSADEHRPAPVVKRQHVAAVTAQGLERCVGRAVGNVYLAIASTAADEKTRLIRRVLQKTEIAYRAIVHRQFDLLSCKEMCENVEVILLLKRTMTGTTNSYSYMTLNADITITA